MSCSSSESKDSHFKNSTALNKLRKVLLNQLMGTHKSKIPLHAIKIKMLLICSNVIKSNTFNVKMLIFQKI